MKDIRVTTKIKQHSLKKLKIIAAVTEQSMIDVLDRLIDAEYRRVQPQGEPQKKEEQ